MLNGGLTDGVFATANFGSDPEGNFEALDARRPNQPHFCMEYWCGWFDHWGEKPHKRDAEDIVARLSVCRNAESILIYICSTEEQIWLYERRKLRDTYQPTVRALIRRFLTENGQYAAVQTS